MGINREFPARAARLAQWKSTSFTRKGSQVQVLQRAPSLGLAGVLPPIAGLLTIVLLWTRNLLRNAYGQDDSLRGR